MYVNELWRQLLRNQESRTDLVSTYKTKRPNHGNTRSLIGAICRYAASRLMTLSSKLCEQHVKNLKYRVKVINMKLESKDDFGKCYHTTSSEPYFYEAAYKHVFHSVPLDGNDEEREPQQTAMIVDNKGRCVPSAMQPFGSKKGKIFKWTCSSKCKDVTDSDCAANLSLKAEFKGPIEELCHVLQDDCPFMHFKKLGHPLPYHTGDKCRSKLSKLRILSAASVHFVK